MVEEGCQGIIQVNGRWRKRKKKYKRAALQRQKLGGKKGEGHVHDPSVKV